MNDSALIQINKINIIFLSIIVYCKTKKKNDVFEIEEDNVEMKK